MARIKNVDVLDGKLLPSILRFGIPLLFVALIQSLFNAVDIMVLGQMADTDAVASVGATTSIVHLLVTISFGISMGGKIVLARLIGEGAKEKTEQTVFTNIMTAIILGALTMVVGIALAPLFLKITNCPAEIYDGALIYLRLYFAAAPAIMIYNFGSNLLQVSGDSQRPLYYMIASGLLNVILNFILCLVMPQKVAAVAIATAASQILGAVLVFRRILVMDNDCRLLLRGVKWNWRSFYKIMANGLPIGFSSSLYSLANLQIQSALNSFGSAAIAGNAAAVNIEGIEGAIAASPWGSAVGVFVGQNVGADNKKRVKRSILICTAISIGVAIVMGVGTTLFSAPLLSLFVDSADAVHYGQIRMLYILLPYAIAALNGILSNTIQAFGYSIFSTLNSILSVFVFRMIWMQNVYPLYPTFHVLMQCFLVSWMLIALVNLIFFFVLYYGRFKKNKIKKMG
jgi:putative MATE family efflux protein